MVSTASVQGNRAVAQPGGSFIHQPVLSSEAFTPEQFTEEHLQFAKTARDFYENEIAPHADAIERKEPGLMLRIMKRAAEVGLFLMEIPESYGGLGLDKVTPMLVGESIARNASFSVTIGAHTNIGTMPTVYYGTAEQKERYLPRLASGELIAAYCLSEPDSGSDALAAKTTARLNAAGTHYVLNGTKQWITNGAFADLFTVFAQVDGDKFTAFLVEKSFDGVTIGAEEHKLGIRGSSTTQLILEDVHVPVENVLGDIGRGHKIAFNILNIGRWKLGAASIGGAKNALEMAIKYANERKQFKKPISAFGLIRQKIARAATQIYAGESMAYRTGGLVDARLNELDPDGDDYAARSIEIIEDFTIEASILKVFGSEALFEVADEALQIHGGNGYVEDYPVERILRDARINRIFEGTNEINRLIIPATILKRALKGRLPLMQFTQEVLSELASPETLPRRQPGPLGEEIWATELAKRAAVFAASSAAQRYMQDLQEKQVLLGNLADMFIAVYAMDSAVLRAHQALQAQGAEKARVHVALAKLFVFDARNEVFQKLRRVAMMVASGEELTRFYDNVSKLDASYPIDFMTLQDQVAEHMLAQERYDLAG